MKVYRTTYALSLGVETLRVETLPHDHKCVRYWGQTFRLGDGVFVSAADAIADAENRRIKRLASLRKQIAKLEALTFTVPTEETRR
jgi:hypothetical protein